MIAFKTNQALIHLVDDDEMVLRALNRLLDAAGYQSMTYGSAEEFLTGLSYTRERRSPERY